MSLLELDGIVKRFGSTTAVDRLDLQIQEGEFVVLLGPSGCGKTTTLRMVAGFETPTEGQILVDGSPVSSPRRVVPPERREMGMMFQSYAVWPHMTVHQNVAYGLKLKRVAKQDLAAEVHRALATVRMEGHGDRYPAELSGGQQQRVALARALAVEPKILLMDEPLSNLDAKLREEMRTELHRLHAALGFTTVYVTHDQGEAMALADRIVVLKDGQVQQVGSPEDLYMRPANAFVAGFLGRANIVPGVAGPAGTMTIGARQLAGTYPRELAPGTKVFGIIRPVGVEIVPDASSSDADVFDCTVEDLLFLGEAIEVVLRVPDLDTDLLATLSPYVGVRAGMRLRCRLRGTVIVPADEHVPSTVGIVEPASFEAVGDGTSPVAAG
ncbi:ABC transporter ATP-binding protein [Pseudonocardia sp. MH-G8]|uniref:ABC transporter ATP-binding protein n=1 Tax=Pseudonocardia sp. MH-G8 TaxID=1854588 RepID=UPI000BA01AF0|nr:ABC transporter ATP-binding protein [Pseudonocardia sp. MH-G8]OZM78112.1 ABC transporter ATP-binding protein [Pseudonocardia sp. MH-G8]